MNIFNRIPSKKQLKATTIKSQKKRLSNDVKKIEKMFYGSFKTEADKGRDHYRRHFTENNRYFWEVYVTARYLRRYKIKDLLIDFEEISVSKTGKRYVDKFDVSYSW